MRFTLPEPHIPEKGGFTDKNNIFGYREFAERLAKMVSNINEPLVITLDGSWGSGKSVFIKQWAGLMRTDEYGGSVLYFDAFANDFHENAFLSLVARIYSLAKKELGKEHPSVETFSDAAKNVGKIIALRGLDRLLSIGTADIVNNKVVAEAIENKVEKVILEKLQKVDEEKALIEAFHKALKEVSKVITEKKGKSDYQPPLVFIVDELDRCRPPFALEILEHIKHFFSVENVCFVLVTNLTHLGATIQGAYGGKIDGRVYLEKFYQFKVLLPEPDFGDKNQRNEYLIYLWDKLQPKFDRQEGNDIRDEIRRLANAHTLSLREIEHVMRSIVLVAAFSSKLILSSLLVTTNLCIMRQTHPKLYALARENNLPWEKVKKFLKIDKDDNIGNKWRYITDSDLSGEIATKYSGWWRTRFPNLDLPRDRLLLQRVFTNEIDSLLGN